MRKAAASDPQIGVVLAVRNDLARELLLEWAERRRFAQLAAIGLILSWFSGAPPIGPLAATVMGSALGASAAAALALAKEIDLVRDASTDPAVATAFLRSAMLGWRRQLRAGVSPWPFGAAAAILAVAAAGRGLGEALESRDVGFVLVLALLWLDQFFLDRIRILGRARALAMLDD